MSKESKWCWKISRLNIVGLPECPDNLSEPAFADLAFSECCNVRRTISIIGEPRIGLFTEALDLSFVWRSRGLGEELDHMLEVRIREVRRLVDAERIYRG